ncbi:MAG: hypothetical protein ACRDRG_20300 [Pseudonocardiaceae bacterium]
MAAKSPNRRRVAAAVGAIERHGGPDDPRLPDLRRDLRAAELEEHIIRIVDAAPPLTAEQRNRIAALLRAPAGNREATPA